MSVRPTGIFSSEISLERAACSLLPVVGIFVSLSNHTRLEKSYSEFRFFKIGRFLATINLIYSWRRSATAQESERKNWRLHFDASDRSEQTFRRNIHVICALGLLAIPITLAATSMILPLFWTCVGMSAGAAVIHVGIWSWSVCCFRPNEF